MAQRREREVYEVVCPHCKQDFRSELLSGASDRHQGFKCPHCRLFVAFERADDPDPVEQREGA
jgi:hypothetical protein